MRFKNLDNFLSTVPKSLWSTESVLKPCGAPMWDMLPAEESACNKSDVRLHSKRCIATEDTDGGPQLLPQSTA